MSDDDIIRGYSSKIFGRLLSYIKPYRKTVILALIALTVATASELLAPIVLQRAVDRTILSEYRRIPPGSVESPDMKKVLSAGEPVEIEGYRFVAIDALAEITGKELEEAREAGHIDREGWYVFEVTEDRLGILSRNPGVFLVEDTLAAISLDSLEEMDPEARRVLRGDDLTRLGRYSLLFLIILCAGLIASFLQVYLMAYTGQSVMIDLRTGLFSHLLAQALSYLTKKPVGSLVTRVSNDVETVNDLFAQVATFLLKDLAMMAGVLAALFLLNYRLATITALSLPPVIVLTLVFRLKARDAYRRVRQRVSGMNTFLSEHISGMEVVQMFAREDVSYRDFEEKNNDLLKANLGEMYVFATFRPLVDLLASVSIGVVLYGGAHLFGASAISLGVLIAFINLVEKFYQPLKDISEQFTILQSAMAGGERVLTSLDEEERIPAGTEPLKPEEVRGNLEFDGVSFAYNPGEPVLRNLSLRVGEGETVALVGYTGAGKTTVANLLTRLWDIGEGRVTLDGRDIKDFTLGSLRRAIQPVDQDVFLFSGTIADNIRLGRDLDDRTIERAARAVYLHDFIAGLPKKYETPVAEDGVNLSTGQRQLLSFARVIAHDPRVLILDEATASIDTRTEQLVQAALKEVLKGRTSLVIAHRLSTIRNADRIYLLSNGRLVEEGTHDELMSRQGAYYSLYRLQYG